MIPQNLITIGTPEGVSLQLELAGLASRIFASGVDLLLMGLLFTLLFIFTLQASFSLGMPNLLKTLSPLLIFSVVVGYPLLFEWLWKGKSPGKTLLGIQVIRTNGQPAGFWESFARMLLRVIDVYLGGTGVLFIMCSKSERRIGDLVAGTIVIKNHQRQPMAYRPFPPSASEKPANSTEGADLYPMTLEETWLLETYLARQEKFLPSANATLQDSLFQYFSVRWNHPVHAVEQLENALALAQNKTAQ